MSPPGGGPPRTRDRTRGARDVPTIAPPEVLPSRRGAFHLPAARQTHYDAAMRTSLVCSAFVVAALAATHGCTLPLEGLSPAGRGGAGPTSGSSAGGAPTTATGLTTTATGMTTSSSTSSTSTGPTECTTDAQCGTNGPCVTFTCPTGTCVRTELDEQMPVGVDMMKGDCKHDVCVKGDVTTVPDLLDVNDDGNQCTINGCDDQGATLTQAANGDACDSGGHCYEGACKECGDSSQCPASGNSCKLPTCQAGSCEIVVANDGSNCGGGTDCKDDGVCTAGVCSNKDKSNGTDCSLGGNCASGGCCSVVQAICEGGKKCCLIGQHCNGGDHCIF